MPDDIVKRLTEIVMTFEGINRIDQYHFLLSSSTFRRYNHMQPKKQKIDYSSWTLEELPPFAVSVLQDRPYDCLRMFVEAGIDFSVEKVNTVRNIQGYSAAWESKK